jgi:hypothetical protein
MVESRHVELQYVSNFREASRGLTYLLWTQGSNIIATFVECSRTIAKRQEIAFNSHRLYQNLLIL